MLPPQGFQKASTLPRPGNSRDASGGLPPVPKFPSPEKTVPTEVEQPEKVDTLVKPVNRPVTSKNAIVYNAVQRKNPVLQAIKGVGVEISDITADYQVGTHNGVLFLSLKYHRLHPEYIHQRIEKMKNKYNVRIMLILCDISEHQQSIRELSKTAIINDLTIFVAWSNEEVAEYLTTLKRFEHKSADILKEKIHQTYPNQLHHVLTSGKKVSKTDANNLSAQFGSFHNIVNQPLKVLSNVKGLGSVKVTSLIDAFNKPFLVGGLKRSAKETDIEIVGTAPVLKETSAIGEDGDTDSRSDEGERDGHEPDEQEEEEEEESDERISKRARVDGEDM